MAHHDVRLDPDVVEISDDEMEYFNARLELASDGASFDVHNPFAALDVQFTAEYSANDREIIDLTAIPDIDVSPSTDPITIRDDSPITYVFLDESADAELITEAACLQMALNVFPDIAVDHVLNLIRKKTTDATRTISQCENVIAELLEVGTYPKESEETSKGLKRKRTSSDELSEYEKGERDLEIPLYEQDALALLKDQFLDVPVRHIANVLNKEKTLFKSYGLIEEQLRNYRMIHASFSKIGKARNKRGTEQMLIERGSQLPKELYAARKKSEREAAKRNTIQEAKLAEEENLRRAKGNNEMGECQCCFCDFPLNRMISCNGDHAHLFCVDCPRKYIENEMGMSHCRPICFATDECKGTFTRRQLRQVLSDKTFERLEHMQQQQDLAGLDFLSECPFCDFKMECLPPEVDKEFRCQNKKCGKTSCRFCHKETHIPLSCAEAKKDEQITLRHIIEEAMSAALIRRCNKCKHPFVKDHGCNKMTCSHCRNLQCYVCSQNVKGYNHFGDVGQGRCPLHDNIEDRHEQEVRKAAGEAMTKVRAENPQLSEADLMVQVSDHVRRAEDGRKGRAVAENNAFPYQMVNGQPGHRDIAAGHIHARHDPAAYVAPYNDAYAAAPAPALNNAFPVAPQLVLGQGYNEYWHNVQQAYQPRFGGGLVAMVPGRVPFVDGDPAGRAYYPGPIVAPAPAPAPAPIAIPIPIPAPRPNQINHREQDQGFQVVREALLGEDHGNQHIRRMLRYQQEAAMAQGRALNQLQQVHEQQVYQQQAYQQER